MTTAAPCLSLSIWLGRLKFEAISRAPRFRISFSFHFRPQRKKLFYYAIMQFQLCATLIIHFSIKVSTAIHKCLSIKFSFMIFFMLQFNEIIPLYNALTRYKNIFSTRVHLNVKLLTTFENAISFFHPGLSCLVSLYGLNDYIETNEMAFRV